MELRLKCESTFKGNRVMAKHRPHGPKGHSSGRPKSGQRSLSGARPGGSGPRPRPGGGSGPGPRRHTSGGPHGPKAQRPGSRPGPGVGPERRDRAEAAQRRDRAETAEPRSRATIEPGKPERLQKILAHAGLGSRRGCEELILQGRVTVDGQVVREMGTKVDPAAKIAVDGEPIRLERPVYYAVNKPEGYVSTNSDPSGRRRVIDLVPEIPQRVYSVGRLDEDSTGLMILTNDGELANRLAHPRFGVEKLYRALVAGSPSPETLSKLTEGVWLSDGKVRAKRARIAGRQGQATVLELVLAEGKKREIRRMLAKLGHKVMSLNRVAIGPITLRGLPVGECRPLTRQEVELLRKVASGISVSVLGFADDRDSRTHRGPARGRHGDQPAARGRHGDRPAARGRHGEADAPRGRAADQQQEQPRHGPGRRQGQAHGPGRRPGAGRPAGPPRPEGRPPRHIAADAEAAPPIQGPAGPQSTGGPKRGPRGPQQGGVGPRPGSRGPQPTAGGPRRPAGPAPQAKRPPARPTQGPIQKRDEEPTPRRRIIGLGGPAAAELGGPPAGRKRPTARKPRPPRSALGSRPGRLRSPRPKADQDDEQ
jgi:23S rRNA pseudouridine2605 synthase